MPALRKMTDNLNHGHRKRLKERFALYPASVPDYELLEMVLFNAIPRKDVKTLAKSLINGFGNFAKVINLDEAKLKSFAEENDIQVPQSIVPQFALIKESIARTLKEKIEDTVIIGESKALNDYLATSMSHKDTESFRVLYLNTKNHLISEEIQDVGTIDQTQVYPREIVKRALFHGAASIILVHNHPSGVANPSKADILITNKIVEACKTIEVGVHDHVIVGKGRVFSFRANNLL